MAGHQAGKKSLEFRMSKKVAELTQVVHMLFTRNHESEVEKEALKDAYEYEISLVIHDAETKIQKLDSQIRVLEAERANSKIQEQFGIRETELRMRVTELEEQLFEEKLESQNSRDLLIQSHRDLEELRQVQFDELQRVTGELDGKDKTIHQLNCRISSLEQEIRDKDSLLDSKGELLRTHEKLRKELEHLRAAVQALEKGKEEATSKNKMLELEIRMLKKELSKRSDRNSAVSRPPPPETVAESDEVEALRQELMRYRMELTNREMNFNRVFSTKQPVHVIDAASRASARPKVMSEPNIRLARERTYHGGEGVRLLFRETSAKDSPSPRSAISTATSLNTRHQLENSSLNTRHQLATSLGERLPQLDSKSRLQRLAKPRPLPKELLLSRQAPGSR